MKKRSRVALISSCDGFSQLALENALQSTATEWVGLLQTQLAASQKLQILKSALKKGSFYYPAYMFLEGVLASRLSPKPQIEEFFINSNLPILQTSDVNSTEVVQWLRDRSPDLVLSVRPGLIFRKSYLDLQLQTVNLHCTKLPKYRGIGGVLQALASDEHTLGCSLHLIDSPKIDSGAVVAQSEIPAREGKSVFAHTLALYKEASKLIFEFLQKEPVATHLKQISDEKGSYHSWPAWGDLKRLKSHGRRLMTFSDWRS